MVSNFYHKIRSILSFFVFISTPLPPWIKSRVSACWDIYACISVFCLRLLENLFIRLLLIFFVFFQKLASLSRCRLRKCSLGRKQGYVSVFTVIWNWLCLSAVQFKLTAFLLKEKTEIITKPKGFFSLLLSNEIRYSYNLSLTARIHC